MSEPSPSQEESPTRASARVDELHVGAVIAGAYTLRERLGEGGMGVVWAADRADPTAGPGPVALKFLKDASASRASRRRFLGEARVAAAIRHPHVRAVHDVVELPDGTPVLVLQRLEGESLAKRLRREERLSVEETASILIAVVSAVGAAHEKGVVHRDLKPENVFLATAGADARVQVLDFGIAKWTLADGETDSMQTASGALLGTPCFMAPEQVFGEKRIDHRADVWALGLVLYQCLSGVLPTRAENVGQVMKIIVGKPIPRLDERLPELPAGLADLVARMLVRDRWKRLSDLRDVARELEQHTDARAPAFGPPLERPDDDHRDEGLVGGATTLDSTEMEAPPRPSSRWSATAAPVSHDPEPAPARRRWVWAAPAAILGAGAITVGAIATRGEPPVGQGGATQSSAMIVDAAPRAPTSAPPPTTSTTEVALAPSASAAPSSAPAASARVGVGPRPAASATAKPSAAPTSSAFAPSERFE